MILDFHTHVFPPWIREQREAYLLRDPGFAALYRHAGVKMATVEELIASMDRAGVECSVVLNFGWQDHRLCVETNDYILEAVAKYGERLVGFCAIQPRAGEQALRELERCARAGVRGIGEFRPDEQGFDLADEPMMRPLVEIALRHRLVLLTHASEPLGHRYPGKGQVTPDHLYRFLLRFSQVPKVLAHWGGGLPFYALMPEVAKVLAHTYFDTAASHLLYRPQIFSVVAALVGPERVLFGSDAPLVSQAKALNGVRSLCLPQEQEQMVLGANGRRLLEAYS